MLNKEQCDEALEYFKKAAELGPPAVGMHTYYHAKCLQFMGKHCDAERILLQASEIDKESISPLLDLVEHNLNINQMEKAKYFVQTIINNSVFYEQLQEDEIIMLKNILNN